MVVVLALRCAEVCLVGNGVNDHWLVANVLGALALPESTHNATTPVVRQRITGCRCCSMDRNFVAWHARGWPGMRTQTL